MLLLPDFKRGDSFELPIAVTEKTEAGVVPVDISTWQMRMSAREANAAGRVVQRFEFDPSDLVNGKGIFRATPDETRRWPLGIIVLDIVGEEPPVEAGEPNQERTSQTMKMTVGERVTR